MATYECAIRTNYFRVTDEDAFRNLMSRVYGNTESVAVFEKTDASNVKRFGFGCYGGISGLKNSADEDDDECDESSYEQFIDQLQVLLPEDEAVILQESGHEKLNYIIGGATIITKNKIKALDITFLAKQAAASILNIQNWTTQLQY